VSVYQYPLTLSFKIMALSPQVSVTDASGKEIFYVQQKMFKLKEDISIYRDNSKSQEVFRMKADRIIDFSARYDFTNTTTGMTFGAVKREGMRSLWKASYNIMSSGDTVTHHIKEDNPWLRVLESLLNENIPFIGYFINPSYTVYQSGAETPVLHLAKKPAFFEGRFEITKAVDPTGEEEENRLLLSLLMMTLLERMRG
jgi:uncharacterized protein YxjI